MSRACHTNSSSKNQYTYQPRTGWYGCWGGRQVADKSLIQATACMKPCISDHRGNTIRAHSLHGEPRADHRGRTQVQVHVSPEGRKLVVQRWRDGPPAAMASPGHIMCQVSSLSIHLHRGYKHIIWEGHRQKVKRQLLCDLSYVLWHTRYLTSCFISFCSSYNSKDSQNVFGQSGVWTLAFSSCEWTEWQWHYSYGVKIKVSKHKKELAASIQKSTSSNCFSFWFYCWWNFRLLGGKKVMISNLELPWSH